MKNGHITIEEFRKCDILREHGYTIKLHTSTVKSYLFGGVPTDVPIMQIIAYKEDIQHISQKFAEEHLLENVFDEFVLKGE